MQKEMCNILLDNKENVSKKKDLPASKSKVSDKTPSIESVTDEMPSCSQVSVHNPSQNNTLKRLSSNLLSGSTFNGTVAINMNFNMYKCGPNVSENDDLNIKIPRLS